MRRQRRLLCACGLLGALLALAGCQRSHGKISGRETNSDLSSPASSVSPTKTEIVTAAWYNVPPDSIAQRRAPGEMTAAHDDLPLGTRVRVTDLENGRSVIVRITDRGIPRSKPRLDLCRPAAEQLGMIRKGVTRVRMEVFPNE